MDHPEHLWKNSEMSDIETDIFVVLATVRKAAPAGDPPSPFGSFTGAAHDSSNHTVLQKFPGHSQILGLCRNLKVAPQVLQLSMQSLTVGQPVTPPAKDSSKASSMASNTAGSTPQPKQQPEVTITLPDKSFYPAAVAVLEGLYHIKPWPELLGGLIPQQQVQAAVLADMWGLKVASKAAVAALQSAIGCTDTVSAVLDELLSLRDMPSCLLPVFEQILLSKYGDLEAVWAPDGASLQESLLALPLFSMELLLASNKLKVASEDTVLYTAQAYVDKQTNAAKETFGATPMPVFGAQQASAGHLAVDKLAPLVRCPHLSQFWLSALVLSDDADKLLMRGLQPQLERLLLVRQAQRRLCWGPSIIISHWPSPSDVLGAPASWLLPVRGIQPVSSRQLEWEVDVAAIRQAAQDSAIKKESVCLYPPNNCLLGGVMWGMSLGGRWDAGKQGSTVRLAARALHLPAGTLCRCSYMLECVDVTASNGGTDVFSAGVSAAWGCHDFFKLGFMSSGFDGGAWAAKGLPASGSIKLRLTVKDVGV